MCESPLIRAANENTFQDEQFKENFTVNYLRVMNTLTIHMQPDCEYMKQFKNNFSNL